MSVKAVNKLLRMSFQIGAPCQQANEFAQVRVTHVFQL